MLKRIQLLLRYLSNNRIKEYENILQEAIANDYQLISLRDYSENKYNDSGKLFILRHDVDHESQGLRLIFEAEKKAGVKASYYFRNSTFNPLMMKEIENYGSEASLHFEPIADYVKANPQITTREELHASDFKVRCLEILKADLKRFRELLDIPCTTIASHGEWENRLVGTPNNFLTENEDTYEELGITLEAYNKTFISEISSYICDGPMELNGGYTYGRSPLEAIAAGDERILFLSHPSHWHNSKKRIVRKIAKVLFKPSKRKDIDFKRL